MSRIGREKGISRVLERHSRRAAVTIGGFVLLIAGIVLALPLVPGPGLLLVIAGLALLGTEYEWARKYLRWAREKSRRAGQYLRSGKTGGGRDL